MFHERFLKRKRKQWAQQPYYFPKIDWYGTDLYTILKDKSIQNGPNVIMVLSDTLSDLYKLNYGKYSKYQLCSSKIDMT